MDGELLVTCCSPKVAISHLLLLQSSQDVREPQVSLILFAAAVKIQVFDYCSQPAQYAGSFHSIAGLLGPVLSPFGAECSPPLASGP